MEVEVEEEEEENERVSTLLMDSHGVSRRSDVVFFLVGFAAVLSTIETFGISVT